MRAAGVGSLLARDAAGAAGPCRSGASSATVLVQGELTEAVRKRVVAEILGARNATVLRLVINSQGGFVAAADSIVRAIHTRKGGVVAAYVGRRCCSAAMRILLAASARVCTVNSELVLHPAQHAAEDLGPFLTARDHRRHADYLERLDETEMSELRRFPFSDSERAIMARGDLNIAPERAAELGIVHQILDRLPQSVSRDPLDMAKRRQVEARSRFVARVPPGRVMGI
jgi:ATP-dependent protease ClpP protease subunit